MKTLTIALLSLASVLAQTKRPMTPDDVMAVKSVNNARMENWCCTNWRIRI